jgi:hypothetical protein
MGDDDVPEVHTGIAVDSLIPDGSNTNVLTVKQTVRTQKAIHEADQDELRILEVTLLGVWQSIGWKSRKSASSMKFGFTIFHIRW